ncbi:MAG: hypothetical protein IKW59_05425 [Clostridia bacterium]|nr:hypothetical protein [Clostridia bacterium]
MIKIIECTNKKINYKAIYNRSARVINIESNIMNDECKPYEESTGCMVFLIEKYIGEIEIIYPIEIKNTKAYNCDEMETIYGTPTVMVNFEDKNATFAIEDEKLILILNDKEKADKKYVSGECSFYVAGDEVVAIACENVHII